MPKKGIIKLAELVISVLDDNDNFTGTVYGGDPIVQAAATSIGRTTKVKSPEHPNLLKKLIEVQYLRVRIGAGDPHISDLLVAVRNKLLSDSGIRDSFDNRVVFVDDPDDPAKQGETVKYPFLGIHDASLSAPFEMSGQREERITAELWIYQQRFPKQMNESMIGD